MKEEIITLKEGKAVRLSDLFVECNNLYFNGCLRKPFVFTYIGTRECSMAGSKRNKKGRIISNFIGIAVNIEWTEENLRRVMLREMASIYAAGSANKSIRKYGKEFKAVIEELNSKYGLCLSAGEYRFDFLYKPKPNNPFRYVFNLIVRKVKPAGK